MANLGARLVSMTTEPLRFIAPSLIATLVFYIQHLKAGGQDAGYLYTGDVLGYYWPALVKLHDLFWSHHFVAIDFSSYNGSSAFLLTANLYNVHPLIVLTSLIVPASITFEQTGYWLVLMVALHTFIASYYAHRLMCDFFGFPFLLGAMVGVLFGFSSYLVASFGEPSFIFSIAVLPWMAHAALYWAYRPSLRAMLWACLPVICSLLGGYGPLGLASAGLAAGIVALRTLVLEDGLPMTRRARICIAGIVPTLCAMALLSPYLYLSLKFNAATGSAGSSSLFFSALQLAEKPQTILRLLSPFLKVTGPVYEFTPVWGFSSLCIATVFIFGHNTFAALTKNEQRIFYISSTIYVLSVLAIYGIYSPISNVLYSFVPVIGKMHIYQRFLYATSLFYAILVALMVKAVVTTRPPVAIRIVLFGCVFMTFAIAYVVGAQPDVAKNMGVDGYVVFDLMLATLVAMILLWPSGRAAYVGVIVLLFLTPLSQSYNYSQEKNTLEHQKTQMPLELDDSVKARIVEYMKQRSKKALYKYADLTPFWTKSGIETFPKSFPYFVQHDIDISSYGGFSFYLAARKQYVDTMPIGGEAVALQPNWELIRAQGGDFVVALADQVHKGALDHIATAADIADSLLLPNDVMVVPLHAQMAETDLQRKSVFNNGYFRVRSEPAAAPGTLVDLALNKPAAQSGGNSAALAVDGNTDGNYAHGSVAHSGKDLNAWLQVDLGAEQAIDDVTVWNRTDCCGERLHDYWLLLSDTPFPDGATAAEIAKLPQVWSRRMEAVPQPSQVIRVGDRRARYVRVQLAGTLPVDTSYLALAELQVFGRNDHAAPPPVHNDIQVTGFRANGANQVAIDISASSPVAVDYLLSDNPKLRYELNGKRVDPVDRSDVLTFNLPAGSNTLRVIYRDRVLSLFWIVYAIYFVALVLSPFTVLVSRRTRPTF